MPLHVDPGTAAVLDTRLGDRPLAEDAPLHPRSARARKRIKQATIEILAEVGPNDLTVEQVASRAHASKQTIYRLWPSREAMIREAVQEQVVELEEPNTGTLAGDLMSMVRIQLWFYTESPMARVLPKLQGAAANDPALFEVFQRGGMTGRRAIMRRVVMRGIGRGEVAADTDPDLLLDMLLAPLQRRVFFTFQPVDEAYGAQVVERVLRAFAPPHRGE